MNRTLHPLLTINSPHPRLSPLHPSAHPVSSPHASPCPGASMQIRIKGYTFQLSEPFSEGSQLTRGEAQALNNLRAENIQDNLRKLIVEATAGLDQGELLPQSTLDELQSKLTNYDSAYQFLEKHQPRPRLGDIEVAVREVAEELVASRARAGGLELTPEELELSIGEAEGLPAVLEEARARVSARRRATQGGLEDL